MRNKGFRRGCGIGSVSRWARGCREELGGNNLYWPCHHHGRGKPDAWRGSRMTGRYYTLVQFLCLCGFVVLGVALQYLDHVLFAQERMYDEAWIATAVALGASVLSSVIGGASSSKAARKAQHEQEIAKNQENAMLRRKRNEAYVDTAAGQRLLTQAREFSREQWKKAQGASKVGGATDAATAMAKESGNKMMGNTLANMAANDTARQDKADYAQIESDRRHAQIMSGYEMQRAQAISQAASQASNAMMSAAGSLDSGAALSKSTGGSSITTPPLVGEAWEASEAERMRRMGRVS